MNKKLRKNIAKILLAASLTTLSTTAAFTKSASAITYSQENLSVQTIYRENGYIIAQVNASYRATCEGVDMICQSDDFDDSKVYYIFGESTKTYEDGTEVTSVKNGDKYLVTFKINLNVFKDTSTLKGYFETETFGGSIYENYEDTNNGKYYTL